MGSNPAQGDYSFPQKLSSVEFPITFYIYIIIIYIYIYIYIYICILYMYTIYIYIHTTLIHEFCVLELGIGMNFYDPHSLSSTT